MLLVEPLSQVLSVMPSRRKGGLVSLVVCEIYYSPLEALSSLIRGKSQYEESLNGHRDSSASKMQQAAGTDSLAKILQTIRLIKTEGLATLE